MRVCNPCIWEYVPLDVWVLSNVFGVVVWPQNCPKRDFGFDSLRIYTMMGWGRNVYIKKNIRKNEKRKLGMLR